MESFSWINVYNKIANKILEYKSRPIDFVNLMYKMLEEAGLMISEEKGSNLDFDGQKRCRYEEIDPISFMNRFDMYSEINRKKLIETFQKNTGMEIDIPNDFSGIPSTNPQMSAVIRFKDEREYDDISNIWEMFDVALTGNMEDVNDRNKFIEYYDKVISKPNAKFNISMGLFKIRPDVFLNLDKTNREYIKKKFNLKINGCPNGEKYLNIVSEIKDNLSQNGESLLDFSYNAWKSRSERGKHYWIYAPGHNAAMWEECLEKGIMLLGYDEVGDLTDYEDTEQIMQKVKETYNKENPMNDKCALDDFRNKIQLGDIIIVKKGRYTLLGYGEVTSEYYYDNNRETYNHVRDVKWIKNGEWNVSSIEGASNHTLVLKTLTDLTQYGDYPNRLMKVIDEDASQGKRSEKMDEKNYFWLYAKPEIWSCSELPVGEFIEYTAVNENGNKRQIYRNFVNAKKGDIVIGYESSPIKEVVAILEVEEELNNNVLKMKKIENLVKHIPYHELKALKELEKMEAFQGSQGSLFKVTSEEYNVIMDIIREYNPKLLKETKEKYTKEDFLNDVYLDESEYDKVVNLLRRKKNMILQGAPGVGKTYMAKRLAYSMMEEKDNSRIKLVQFHQSYGYEDFIEGYRPTENSFELKTGVFYDFCKLAENNPEKEYFFIIDEINRGNLSKIFGELLMLIENDKRGDKLSLAYSKMNFSVPKNLFIIGMMNTADRSLALIDYALRRRFAFYNVEPAFENEQFKKYQEQVNSDLLNRLIELIKVLNIEIEQDSSLGNGFKIGHSYFCNLESVDENDIKSIITYEISPLLEEYWFDDTERFKTWINKLNGVING